MEIVAQCHCGAHLAKACAIALAHFGIFAFKVTAATARTTQTTRTTTAIVTLTDSAAHLHDVCGQVWPLGLILLTSLGFYAALSHISLTDQVGFRIGPAIDVC